MNSRSLSRSALRSAIRSRSAWPNFQRSARNSSTQKTNGSPATATPSTPRSPKSCRRKLAARSSQEGGQVHLFSRERAGLLLFLRRKGGSPHSATARKISVPDPLSLVDPVILVGGVEQARRALRC